MAPAPFRMGRGSMYTGDIEFFLNMKKYEARWPDISLHFVR